MDLLIGADPELFVAAGGRFISAHGLVAGTKEQPLPVNRGAVQVDGMALEFNIDPADNSTTFLSNIEGVLAELRKMVPDNYEFVLSATADFDAEYMSQQPEVATRLGCDPDFNAYTREWNPQPLAHPTMRTAAGHVHLGWGQGFDTTDPMHIAACCDIVQELDAIVGLWALLNEADGDHKRREMYGKAGSFRAKPYGLEYRVLSNFWLRAPALTNGVFNLTQRAFANVLADQMKSRRLAEQGHDVRKIIDNRMIDQAKVLFYSHIRGGDDD